MPKAGNGASDAAREMSQRKGGREVPEKFLVALSFSGKERKSGRRIAEAVERRLGPGSVFFDKWFEYYIAGHDADVKLQRIYGTGCELVVLCVSATYGAKAWTRAEHEAIRARLMQARTEEDPRQRDRILPIRVGDGDVDGIPCNAIVPDVRGRTPEEVAELIVARLQFVMGKSETFVVDGESAGNSVKRHSKSPRVCMVAAVIAAIIALMVIAPKAVAAAVAWLRDVVCSNGTEPVPPSFVPSPARPSMDVGKRTLTPVRQDDAPAPVPKNAQDPPDGAPGRVPGHPNGQQLTPTNWAPHRGAPERRAPSGASGQPTSPPVEGQRHALTERAPVTGRELFADEIGKRQVRRAVLDNVDLLRRCYEDQLQINPYLEGTVYVSFVISGAGGVVSSSATGLGDAVDYCVAGEIAGIAFPARLDGSGVVVHYPLLFRRAQSRGAVHQWPTVELGVPTVLQPRIK